MYSTITAHLCWCVHEAETAHGGQDVAVYELAMEAEEISAGITVDVMRTISLKLPEDLLAELEGGESPTRDEVRSGAPESCSGSQAAARPAYRFVLRVGT